MIRAGQRPNVDDSLRSQIMANLSTHERSAELDPSLRPAAVAMTIVANDESTVTIGGDFGSLIQVTDSGLTLDVGGSILSAGNP